MPRISSHPEDAMTMQGKWLDGWGKIVDAKSLVFQFPPAKEDRPGRPAGSQDPPSLFCELTIQRYDNDNGDKSAAQPETVLLSMERASKDTGELDVLRPGDYPDGDLSKDPVDKGGALGTEGNTVYSVKDGYQFNSNTKWIRFTNSLYENAFKPDILKRTYFPDLIGLYAFFQTVTLQKFRDDMDSAPTAFVVKKGSVKEFPYEKKAAATKVRTGKAVTASAPATPSATPIAAVAPAAEPNGESSAEDIATAIITDTLAKLKKGATLASVDKLKVDTYLAISKHKPAVPATMKKEVTDLLKDSDWIVAVGTSADVFAVQDDGKVVFAA